MPRLKRGMPNPCPGWTWHGAFSDRAPFFPLFPISVRTTGIKGVTAIVFITQNLFAFSKSRYLSYLYLVIPVARCPRE